MRSDQKSSENLHREFDEALAEVYRTEQGKNVLLEIVNLTGYFKYEVAKNDREMLIQAGKRSVGQDIMASLARSGLDLILPEREE